jgi:hypothetical protein
MLNNNLSTKHKLFTISKKTLFNNLQAFDPLLAGRHSNGLRVISTPEFPVPYYQRLMRHPPSPENMTIDLSTVNELPNDGTVIRVRESLRQTPHGLKILNYVENHVKLQSFITICTSVTEQCNIYADDLMHYLDATHEENVRILKSVDLADALRL